MDKHKIESVVHAADLNPQCFIGEDGNEYYVAFVAPWAAEIYRELSNPWPEIYRRARRRLASIGA